MLRRVYLRKLLSWACSTAVEPAGPSAQEPQAHSARGAMQPSTRCEVTWEAQESLQRRLASRRPASCLREVCLDAALFVLIGIKTTQVVHFTFRNSPGQQHLSLGTWQEYRTPGPTPDALNQHLQLKMLPGDSWAH